MVAKFEEWAADGGCILLNVELDSPSPDEPPRITIRGGRPLSEVKSGARMTLALEVSSIEGLTDLKHELSGGIEGKDEVLARLHLDSEFSGEFDGAGPLVSLGKTFQLDGDLAERLAEFEGLENVSLSAKRGPANLRLVA